MTGSKASCVLKDLPIALTNIDLKLRTHPYIAGINSENMSASVAYIR